MRSFDRRPDVYRAGNIRVNIESNFGHGIQVYEAKKEMEIYRTTGVVTCSRGPSALVRSPLSSTNGIGKRKHLVEYIYIYIYCAFTDQV